MASDDMNDFAALARQYWAAWGETLRDGVMPDASQPGMQAWQQAMAEWTRLAHSGRGDVDATVGRFNTQASDWYAQMQQVAARFAGQQASADDIAAAWQQALGASGDNPFKDMLHNMRGQGMQGLEQWLEDAAPWLQAWQRETATTLAMPTFGVSREHQQRWQQLAQAQLDYQQCSNDCNALLARAGQDALERFKKLLGERAAAEQKVQSARALFDLWVDAAEAAYAELALSAQFRQAYGALVNSQMRLRAGVQREVEQAGAALGMPTRTEMDAAHRKIAELERALRRLRHAGNGDAKPKTTPAPTRASTSKPGTAKRKRTPANTASRTTSRPATKTTAAGKSPARKAAARKPGKAASGKTASSKAARPTRSATRKPATPARKQDKKTTAARKR